MNNEQNLPILTIDIKPELHDFLIHEFGEDENHCIKLHKRNDIGRYIDSMWVVSDLPVKRKYEKWNNPVRIILPISQENQYIVRNNFISIPIYREQQVNDFLEATYNVVIREYFVTGYEKQFKKNMIIEGILKAFNIRKNAISYDRIKKKDYRNRENVINSIVNDLKNGGSQWIKKFLSK